MEPTEEMRHYAALAVDEWLGTIPSWPPDPRANHLVTLRGLIAKRLASIAEQARREGEDAGFRLAHELMSCGHPRACWQDRNWPESEESYDPTTGTSNPPMEYRCVACESLPPNTLAEKAKGAVVYQRCGPEPWRNRDAFIKGFEEAREQAAALAEGMDVRRAIRALTPPD